ncbi:MAG: hypothetical protein CBE44_01665 [Bacteroidetes bacterium TMED284]|nr:hypothetical protein [Balneola sp.]OUX48217.1 MAG: hypothetical protein CBE44_01665 [Bacteroidetes bacterium TMED284]|tara:strand:+ start:3201 stop:4001 length:801 start_codon:yes stop_codon:yes gene_type:complete
MIDTHAHIFLPDYSDDVPAMISRAADLGIRHVLMPAINPESVAQMEAIAQSNSGNKGVKLHPMIGLHPCDVHEQIPIWGEHRWTQKLENWLHEYASLSHYIGIGETGLDYYWSKEYKKEQMLSLDVHFELAKSVNKPIVLHNRDSTHDLLQTIAKHQNGSVKGVWHCFNGTYEEGMRAIDLGFHLGIGGVVTFKNTGVAEVVRQLPFDKLILETDSPYLSPTPLRGQRNEPAHLAFIQKKLGELFELSQAEVEKQTDVTAASLFSL